MAHVLSGQNVLPRYRDCSSRGNCKGCHALPQIIARHDKLTPCSSYPGLDAAQRRLLGSRCCATGDAADPPSPEELMRTLAAEYGVRVYEDEPGGGDGDYDDADEDAKETWDDVVSDLGKPWDMRPAKVGLDEDLFGPPEAATRSPSAGHTQDPAGPAAAAGAAPISRIGWAELWDLAGLAPLLAGSVVRQASDDAGSGGSSSSSSSSSSGGDDLGSRPRVVLVDIREPEEVAASAASPTSPRRPLPAAPVHAPLSSLRRPQADQLAAAGDFLAVLETGDHRGEQAVVRLTRVYGIRRVVLYDDDDEEEGSE